MNDSTAAATEAVKPASYAPEVQTDGTGHWYGNALRFQTAQEAEAQVADLSMRWTLVRDTRVVPTSDPPNYRWDSTVGLVRLASCG